MYEMLKLLGANPDRVLEMFAQARPRHFRNLVMESIHERETDTAYKDSLTKLVLQCHGKLPAIMSVMKLRGMTMEEAKEIVKTMVEANSQ